MKVLAERDKGPGRIRVSFGYDKDLVDKIKTVDGRKYDGETKSWTVPLDMTICRRLRTVFGRELSIGPALHEWASEQVRVEAALGSMAMADTATLERLPSALPALYRAIHLGPLGLQMTPEEADRAMDGPASYQAADVAFMASSVACLNGNQPGLGKTIETIASIWECGTEEGSHLVIAPSAAVDGVWDEELVKWQAGATKEVAVFACIGTRPAREKTLARYLESKAAVKWVVVNPQMLQYRKDPTRTSNIIVILKGKKADTGCYCGARKQAHEHYESPYPVLHEQEWNTIVIDECHKGSIRNHKTITAKALNDVRRKPGGKKIALSGTPMKKKGSDLWGTLNYLRPDVFTSFWRFAETFFDIEKNDFGQTVGGLREGMEGELFRTLAPYMLRRTKAECLPWLPAKQRIDVWCEMGAGQARMYKQMVEDGMAVLADEERVSTTSILAEFTRLKQFATCEWIMDGAGDMTPTEASCKVDAMLEKMEEHGMFDEGSTEKQIVFSQSRKVIEMVANKLMAIGIRTDIISGKQNKEGERRKIKDEFQNGGTRVLCVVTTAGGVALTLDAASVAHFLDETWSPDEMEQAEDRIHRASRNHQVTIYNYRSRNTIDEYVMGEMLGKREVHEFILDVRREMLRT